MDFSWGFEILPRKFNQFWNDWKLCLAICWHASIDISSADWNIVNTDRKLCCENLINFDLHWNILYNSTDDGTKGILIFYQPFHLRTTETILDMFVLIQIDVSRKFRNHCRANLINLDFYWNILYFCWRACLVVSSAKDKLLRKH